MSDTGKVVTASRLRDGAVVFLARSGEWVEEIDGASVAVDDDAAAALAEQGKAAEAVNHVTGSYLIDVERRDATLAPSHIRERIRVNGPSINDDKRRARGFAAAGQKEASHVSL